METSEVLAKAFKYFRKATANGEDNIFANLKTPSKMERTLSPIQAAKKSFRSEVRSLSKAFKYFRAEKTAIAGIIQAGLDQGKRYNSDLAYKIVYLGELGLLTQVFTDSEQKRELWSADQLIHPFLRAITVKKK